MTTRRHTSIRPGIDPLSPDYSGNGPVQTPPILRQFPSNTRFAKYIHPGTVFETKYEDNCLVNSNMDSDGFFTAFDSLGVLAVFNVESVTKVVSICTSPRGNKINVESREAK